MKKLALVLGAVVLLVLAGAGAWFANGWWGTSSVKEESAFTVPQGASVTAIARKLEEDGLIPSADAFLLRARLFASDASIKAGEYAIPSAATPAEIMDVLQSGAVVLNFVTIPEGLPSILVHERLMAVEGLTGEIEVPEEGTILPDTYDFETRRDAQCGGGPDAGGDGCVPHGSVAQTQRHDRGRHGRGGCRSGLYRREGNRARRGTSHGGRRAVQPGRASV